MNERNTMRLERADGCYFELEVVGYEFPASETEEYDSNWLMIRIDVKHPLGSWSATDPSLLTYEMGRLADWLDEIRSGSRSQPDEYFTEPNLEFHVAAGDGGEESLRVCFALECRPPWASRDLSEDEEHFLDFPLAGVDLAGASGSLREQLSTYPQRAER